MERTLQESAPERDVGYRTGTAGPHSQHIRWFPVTRRGRLPWFSLTSFESHAEPQPGKYAVLYVDEKGRMIDQPRFTVWVESGEPDIRFVDGDRGMEPRLRTCGRTAAHARATGEATASPGRTCILRDP